MGRQTTLLFTLAVCIAATPCRAQLSPRFPREGAARTPFLAADPLATQAIVGGVVLSLIASNFDNAEQAVAGLDRVVDGPADIGNIYGNTWTMVGATAGLAGIGFLAHDPTYTSAAWDMGKSLALTGLVVGVVKTTVNRTRPNGGPHSFPSGHTAVAFTTAPIFSHYFGWKLGVPAYLAAVSTGLGRMEDNKHYLSDVVAGAAIGFAIGRMVSATRAGGNLSLIAGPREVGFSIRY